MSSGNLREFIGYYIKENARIYYHIPQERGGDEQRKEIYGKLYFSNGLFCENTRTNNPIPAPFHFGRGFRGEKAGAGKTPAPAFRITFIYADYGLKN